MAKNKNTLGVIATCVLVTAVLLGILAAALPLWEEGKEIGVGLWKVCFLDKYFSCEYIEDYVSDEHLIRFKVVRFMVVSGILLTSGAVLCGVLATCIGKGMTIFYFVAAGLAVTAGSFFMIALAVYVGKIEVLEEHYNLDVDYAAAFVCDIIAWILAWIGGTLLIGAKMTHIE